MGRFMACGKADTQSVQKGEEAREAALVIDFNSFSIIYVCLILRYQIGSHFLRSSPSWSL